MQAGGDGFGWCVTAEHMTFQDPGVFIPRHICKVPEKRKTQSCFTKNKHTVTNGDEVCWTSLVLLGEILKQKCVCVYF